MKQVAIKIPNMQSTHCQTRVSNAVKGIAGVQIQNLEAGQLTVSVTSENLQNEVVQAIEKVGYTVALEEDDDKSSECSTGCCS